MFLSSAAVALSWDLVDVDTSELGVGPLILTDVLTVVSDLIFRLSDICQGNEGCDKADCKTSSQSAGEDCLTRSLRSSPCLGCGPV